jgi:hypothetical protein
MHEEDVRQSFVYIWLEKSDLTKCQKFLSPGPDFLIYLFQQIYRQILIAGRMVTFPIIVYLAVGYLRRQVTLISHDNYPSVDDDVLEAFRIAEKFAGKLNKWLEKVLQYEQEKDPDVRNALRHNWKALEQFLLYALHEIGPELSARQIHIDPSLCDSSAIRDYIDDKDTGLKHSWLQGKYPIPGAFSELNTLKQMSEMVERINRYIQLSETDKRLSVEREQEHAIRYYLSRAGITEMALNNKNGSNRFRQHLLDLHALAGYQAYGQFIPDAKTTLFVEQLRRRLLEPTQTQRSHESTVDGVTRRGTITQVLKWQLALKEPAIIYERYFNHKMLYLRRINRKSQDLYATLLVIVDLDEFANQRAFHGGRVHSIEREVVAHLVQDCYQMFAQVPKLNVDVFIVVCHNKCVIWHTMLVLSDGTGKYPANTNDVFLQHRPPGDVMAKQSGVADPATFFHFLLPTFELRQSAPGELEQWIEKNIRSVRHERAKRIKQDKTSELTTDALAIADLMVTLFVGSMDRIQLDESSFHSRMASLGLFSRSWEIGCNSHKVSLFQGGKSGKKLECDLDAFQKQTPLVIGTTPNLLQASIRQQFVQEFLLALIESCSQVEIS